MLQAEVATVEERLTEGPDLRDERSILAQRLEDVSAHARGVAVAHLIQQNIQLRGNLYIGAPHNFRHVNSSDLLNSNYDYQIKSNAEIRVSNGKKIRQSNCEM